MNTMYSLLKKGTSFESTSLTTIFATFLVHIAIPFLDIQNLFNLMNLEI